MVLSQLHLELLEGYKKQNSLRIVGGSSGSMGLYYNFLISHCILRHKLNIFLTLNKILGQKPWGFSLTSKCLRAKIIVALNSFHLYFLCVNCTFLCHFTFVCYSLWFHLEKQLNLIWLLDKCPESQEC